MRIYLKSRRGNGMIRFVRRWPLFVLGWAMLLLPSIPAFGEPTVSEAVAIVLFTLALCLGKESRCAT
jgi:hypothetical protein